MAKKIVKISKTGKETTKKGAGSKASSKEIIEVKSEIRSLDISPRKLRLIVDSIKKLSPREAISRLGVLNKKGARLMIKAIRTAIADAKNNFGLEEETFKFKEILANEGKKTKLRDKHHGARFNGGIIHKRRSILRIVIVGSK